MEINILLVDDHSMIRQGLRSFLNEADLNVIGEANNGIEALDFLEQFQIDVLVTDIMMPQMDGIELAKQVHSKYPNVHILALTMMNENYNIKHMIAAGAIGYILKDCTQAQLQLAIRTVAKGEKYFSDEVTNVIMEGIGGKPKLKQRTQVEVPLTERETEVLHLICKEKSNAEIADELFVNMRTIETHKRNLIIKTGCKNVAGMVLYAIERNLFNDL